MLLYHYTSNKAFLSIIEKRELWATDLSLSNDRLEGKWIKSILADLCSKEEKIAPHLDTLVESVDIIISAVGALGVCLSTEGDSLSQWRGYANDGAGVSIGFDATYLKDLKLHDDEQSGLTLEKVIYDVTEQREALLPLVKVIEKDLENGALELVRRPSLTSDFLFPRSEEQKAKDAQAYASLIEHLLEKLSKLFVFKNPAFSEEREWRLLSYLLKSNVVVQSGISALDFVAKDDRIAPMRTISIPLAGTIKRVVLGPRNITPVEVIQWALRKHGFAEVDVLLSSASYR